MSLALTILYFIIGISLGLAVFFSAVYLLLPWIFRKFVSPLFNATYVYKANDFKQKKEGKIASLQSHTPTIEINKDSGIFEVTFGDKRKLIAGLVKVYTHSIQYSNEETLTKKVGPLKLKKYKEAKSEDKLGKFNQFIFYFEFSSEMIPLELIFKEYLNKNFIVFELRLPKGLKHTFRGDFNKLITSFPSFINKSPNKKIFTFRHAIFCPPSRKIKATSAPVLFYDNELNCFIVSPLDGFLNTIISEDKNGRISCGIQGEIQSLPIDFTQKFVLYFGKGINKSMQGLGDILLQYNDVSTKSLYANICTSYLGYWTDNGAYYYYKTEKGLNYEETLVGIKNYFEKHDIPIKYYNFDSWWYQKYTNKIFTTIFRPIVRLLGGGFYGNIIRWEADPDKFSTDLKTFYKERFNKPITAHSRRWDSRSPYTEQFEFVKYKNHAIPLKQPFWNWLMNHAKESGIEVYQQDWMKNQVDSIPYMRNIYDAKELWLSNMALAAKNNEVDIFYCMETPGMLLYTLKHENINISRCSGDYNHRWPLTYIYIDLTQTNILFNTIGINSHPDVFRSRSMEDVMFRPFGERFPELKCLIQILGAGLVCPGDKKENVNWPLLSKTCRKDGLLLKPDRALTVNDLMFKIHRKYYISDTYTKKSDQTWHYVLVTNIWPKRVKETFITPQELGFEDDWYVIYDFYSGIMKKIGKNSIINIGLLKKNQYKYYIFCPITIDGISLIGDINKFITCSNKQFPSVDSSKQDDFIFEIEDISNSMVRVTLFSEKTPKTVSFSDRLPINDVNNKNTWLYREKIKRLEISIFFERTERKMIIVSF